MKKALFKFGVTAAAAALVLAGCASGGGSSQSEDGKETITFINHKTDWEGNGKWDEYIAKFNEKYPDITVEVQTITDYAGQMKTRMNSKEYGDVLMIPSDIQPQDYATFFEPMGDKVELEETYLGLNDRSFEGVSYGIPSQLNATGMVVNMKVFEDAGIKEFPKTPESFLAALKTIKEKNKDVVPPKVDLANGKIAVMVLGSWAVPQIQEANPDNASNITFQAFPITASDGKQYMPVSGDYNYGISVHSEHKEAARKFVDWMVNESDYAKDNGGLPTVKGADFPEALQASKEAGVELFEENPAPEGKESLFSDINNQSELGIGTTDLEKQRIIDAAVGNSSETYQDIMKDFNTRWADAIKAVAGN